MLFLLCFQVHQLLNHVTQSPSCCNDGGGGGGILENNRNNDVGDDVRDTTTRNERMAMGMLLMVMWHMLWKTWLLLLLLHFKLLFLLFVVLSVVSTAIDSSSGRYITVGVGNGVGVSNKPAIKTIRNNKPSARSYCKQF